jgi:hypothetical protein
LVHVSYLAKTDMPWSPGDVRFWGEKPTWSRPEDHMPRVVRPRFEPNAADVNDPRIQRDKLYAELRVIGEQCQRLSDRVTKAATRLAVLPVQLGRRRRGTSSMSSSERQFQRADAAIERPPRVSRHAPVIHLSHTPIRLSGSAMQNTGLPRWVLRC